jgi:SAM-dependent methyltransferase
VTNGLSRLKQLLNVYWLRPETALWRSIDILAMESFQFKSPSLDLGCGDGLFSFIRAGGCIGQSFDAFQSVTGLKDFFSNHDVYDSPKAVNPGIVRKPGYRIDVGFDHKENLLRKARTLGLYRKLALGDANSRLPFDDDQFNSVFSNIVYWLNDPTAVFGEIRRILRPKGRCCVMLPNRTLPEFSFYYSLFIKGRRKEFAFLELLDRGRFAENIKQAKSADQWTRIIDRAGLKVVSLRQYLSKTVVQAWDVGLRPLFPVLCRMTASMDARSLLRIKKDWIATFEVFLEPLMRLDSLLKQGREPGFHCFILEK